MGLDGEKFTYGEIRYKSLACILKYIQKRGDFTKPGGTFVDLGSGQGKGLLAAGLMHSFEKVVGIELLECLHNKAQIIKKRFYEKT